MRLMFILALGAISLSSASDDALGPYRTAICTEAWKLFKTLKYFVNGLNMTEEGPRYEMFCNSFMSVITHNAKLHKTYRMAITERSDMPMVTGFIKSAKRLEAPTYEPNYTRDLEPSVDWREKNVVTPVQNQGQCGSCWAFSASGALSSHYYIKNKNATLIEFSEQDLVDCDNKDGNEGCHGGDMMAAFEYVRTHGIDSSVDYPYKGKEGNCNESEYTPISKDEGFKIIPKNDEAALMKAVADEGPIAVAILATPSFHQYSGGVFDNPDCNEQGDKINHGVLLVGYGTDANGGGDYWLVKNSWGVKWGEKGYIRIKRGDGYKGCKIAQEASFPIV